MKKGYSRNQGLFLPTMTLMIFLLSSCAPAAPVSVPTTDIPLPINTQAPSQAPGVVATVNPVNATDIPAPVMVATPRGPNLEATDPSTVSLASGQLQLVEFFRFT